jgi:hypothetical protein
MSKVKIDLSLENIAIIVSFVISILIITRWISLTFDRIEKDIAENKCYILSNEIINKKGYMKILGSENIANYVTSYEKKDPYDYSQEVSRERLQLIEEIKALENKRDKEC